MSLKIQNETHLEPGTKVWIIDAPGMGRGNLKDVLAEVCEPYAGHPADKAPVAGVCGHLFGDNLYPGDIIEIVET